MRISRLSSGIAITIALSILTACGGGGGGSTPNVPNPTNPPGGATRTDCDAGSGTDEFVFTGDPKADTDADSHARADADSETDPCADTHAHTHADGNTHAERRGQQQ